MLIWAGFCQEKHGCFFEVALGEGFSDEVCYGACGAEALVPEIVGYAALLGEFLDGLFYLLFSVCFGGQLGF